MDLSRAGLPWGFQQGPDHGPPRPRNPVPFLAQSLGDAFLSQDVPPLNEKRFQ
jgi:hypothetical protein